MDLMDLSAVELAACIRRKDVSPVEAVQAALDRIAARRELNAFITVTAEQALAQARLAETAVMASTTLGLLHGVPYSVKDLTWTAGVRTTMGSAIYEDFVPQEDAVPVRRAKAAGAILIGKTTTPEFGHKPSATAPIFGRTLNPHHPGYTPGASSSGAAVAVAAGMGPLALGTDGGGSIRIPASCCGIVGLKGTLGVIPHLQAPDLFSANSFTGPMGRDAADTALLFDVVAGFDARDPYGQGSLAGAVPFRPAVADLRGLRVAWLPSAGNPVDPEVAQHTESAVKMLEQAGAIVEEVHLDFVALEPHFLVVLRSLLAARIGDNLERFADRLDPSLVDAVQRGRRCTAVELHAASFARTRCFSQLEELFTRHDVLVSPTVSAPPLPNALDVSGEIEIAGRNAGTVRAAWYPYTYPMNLTGHPALSMPCGRSRIGLPIGLQIAGPWYSERRLLSICALLEPRLAS